ncbi:MAG TPA: hypothetical protein VJ735_00950 [Actinomycetes bacterium]|nr:hypothetical protein [Actinomycetes bacterium]
MNERREDLSTADLAGQQPTDTAPPDRAAAPDVQRRDPSDDALGREDLAADERSRHATVVEDRRPDQESVATPVGAAAPDHGTGDTASTTGPLLATENAEGFRARWTDIQTGFVDAPRRAVEQADALVAELMQHLASSFADERGRLERHWDQGDDVPTDHLRDAFQRYRSFFERLLAT